MVSDAAIEVTPEENRPLGRVLPAFTLGISIFHTKGRVTGIIDPDSDALESVGAGITPFRDNHLW